MRKQELIHIHGLLAEVASYCEEDESAAMELSEYRSLETRPASIHKAKDAHKEAVFALVGDITESIQEGRSEAVQASAD